MSKLSQATLAATLAFVLACTGGETPMGPASVGSAPAPEAPAPLAVPADAPEPDAAPPDAGNVETPDPDGAGGAAGDTWCCQYDGPLGKTHDLIDNPAECAQKYADHNPEFISSAECAPVCCKYAKDPADLSKGFTWESVAAANCEMRKGTVESIADGATCRDPSIPAPRASTVRPAPPPAPPPPKPPTFRERMGNPHNPRGQKAK
ncbi:MAG: hypothetical protein H6736_23395 [Alphaproteobacteria bacterium]|nr:hypothetical protein [Alphaproteobacteria bacterium]MCB9672913.1 hypothetical protein [Alphaproteobacteria bacterium]MCB9692169.1 hypothetical protein [Alphaproteobacteria bacterium]MCB9694768.1 hypothetical protein [Alphaproteobacteria bacterium]